jgi:hypothetical protein
MGLKESLTHTNRQWKAHMDRAHCSNVRCQHSACIKPALSRTFCGHVPRINTYLYYCYPHVMGLIKESLTHTNRHGKTSMDRARCGNVRCQHSACIKPALRRTFCGHVPLINTYLYLWYPHVMGLKES